jgi:hypothetical protein
MGMLPRFLADFLAKIEEPPSYSLSGAPDDAVARISLGGIMKTMLIAACAAALLAGCQTTQQAAQTMRSEWVGESADSFFVANGPPVSSFPRDNGGQIYTWRGGEASIVRPGSVQTRRVPAQTLDGRRTTTTTVTYQPAQRVNYVCEAQIAADAEGKIESIRISRDSGGMFLSFSRCGELFNRG